MSDFLDRLIANEHGTELAFMPRVPARFEVDRSQPESLEDLAETLAPPSPASPADPESPRRATAARERESTPERIEPARLAERRLERIIEIAHASERTTGRAESPAEAPREVGHADDLAQPQARAAEPPTHPAIRPERIVIASEPGRPATHRPALERWRDEPATVVDSRPTARLADPHATRSEYSQAPAPEIAAEPIVHVSIGRLEIRAAAPAEPPRRRPAPPPPGRLERYLEERNRGRGK